MKPSKSLPLVLLAILLCLTISCSMFVKHDKDQQTASSEKGAVSGGKAAASVKTDMMSQTTRAYTLTGPCERVFLEHPREDLLVTGGKGTFYYPADAETGIPVETGFQTTVEENVAYKFVVAEGDTLAFTATIQL